MMCPEVDCEVNKRLDNGDPVTLAIGKLLDRILTFRLLQKGDPVNTDDREREIREVYGAWDWDAKPEGPGEWENIPRPDIATFSTKLEDIAQGHLEKIRYYIFLSIIFRDVQVCKFI